jgi:hypothetical protein
VVSVVVWDPPRTPQAIRNNFGEFYFWPYSTISGSQKGRGRRPWGVSHTVLECQVSKIVNSDTCPRPTAGAPRGKWPSPTEANLREACEIAKRATQAAVDANIVAGGSTDTPREILSYRRLRFWVLWRSCFRLWRQRWIRILTYWAENRS